MQLVEKRLAALATAIPKIEESLAAMPPVPFAELVDGHDAAQLEQGQVLACREVFDLLRPQFPNSSLAATTVDSETRSLLLEVLREAVSSANQPIGKQAFTLAAGARQQATPAAQAVLLLPFLCIDDADWGDTDIGALPKWLTSDMQHRQPDNAPSSRDACELFCLALGRVHSAWAFHRFGGEKPGRETLLQYLEGKATSCFGNACYREAGVCLAGAIAEAEAGRDRETAARLRLSLARDMAELDCAADAAKEALHVVEHYADTAAGMRAVLPRVYYPFESGEFAAVKSEAAGYGGDPRFAACRAQLLYASWLASVRLRQDEEEKQLREAYLAKYATNPLTAEMYYFLVCQSLAVADVETANQYMDRILAEFPESRVVKPVQGIRDRMAREREKVARQEAKRAKQQAKPHPAP